MTSTGTHTTTYTVADIRKVVDNFAADFSMIAQATGLYSRENVAWVVSDLKIFAEYRYLINVNLILKDGTGQQVRAAVYRVFESAIGWSSERPGNNIWPRMANGSLTVVATFTSAWWNKTLPEKSLFMTTTGLHNSWGPTTEDTSFRGLTPTSGQRYASNGYGWQRTNYG